MTSTPPPLILASGSRYRADMLRRLGVDFEVHPADIDESSLAGESPRALAERLALEKARKVAGEHPGHAVIGADQVASLDDGRILGKPGTVSAAQEQLRAMSGRRVTWHSGLALVGSGGDRCTSVDTLLELRPLSADEIERYVERDRPLDCAGSMRSESLGITLVETMRSDDPTALIGMPLITIARWLRELGCPLP
ncbi:Maf family nucleotide pyrophosphatase [Halomonas denitrificans]|nr:Maf family nucleotide pyrophosphatase [Halomonas denitrificans]